MPRLSSLEDIERLYAERGALGYGEGVSQVEHAVQCAALAEEDGAPPSLIAAALLHDIGKREDLAGRPFADFMPVLRSLIAEPPP